MKLLFLDRWGARFRLVLLGLSAVVVVFALLMFSEQETREAMIPMFRSTHDTVRVPNAMEQENKKKADSSKKKAEKPKIESFRTAFAVDV